MKMKRSRMSIVSSGAVNHRGRRRVSQVSRANGAGVAASPRDPAPGPVARTFAARPLLAALFWSAIRFLVVEGRGQVGAGSARCASQSTSVRRAARAPRLLTYSI